MGRGTATAGAEGGGGGGVRSNGKGGDSGWTSDAKPSGDESTSLSTLLSITSATRTQATRMSKATALMTIHRCCENSASLRSSSRPSADSVDDEVRVRAYLYLLLLLRGDASALLHTMVS